MSRLPTRLPRCVPVGPYRVEVVLVTQAVLRDVMEDEDGGVYLGCWESLLGDDGGAAAGRIYIDRALPVIDKWQALWHELHHALTDIEGWDRQARKAGP